MARWTKEGWASLEHIAENAVAYTGFPLSGIKIIQEAQEICELIESSNGPWKKIQNIFGETRFWHPFHSGKVIVWKADHKGAIFVGVFYSLPEPLIA